MGSAFGLAIALLVVAVIGGIVFGYRRNLARAEFIRTVVFPPGLYAAMRKHRPALTDKDCHLANRALRQFFLAYLNGGRKYVSMPSQVADELWHQFILHTRAYGDFCRQAFGGILHHTPSTALGANRQHNAGLRRVWWYACKQEQLDPRKASRLPLLFALDAKVGIPDGFHYSLDCHSPDAPRGSDGSVMVCAGDFSDSSIDGSTEGFADSGAADSGDGGGGDSGCGGGGCGGGD